MGLLNSASLLCAEASLNRLLATDPLSLNRLARITGKVIALEVSGLGLCLYAIPGPQGVQLQSQFDGEPDCRLEGQLQHYLLMLQAEDKAEQMFGNGITLHGDTALAQQFQRLLNESHIDWQGLLGDYIGDLAASQLAGAAQQTGEQLQQLASSFIDNSVEYLQEESRILPPQAELDGFLDQVDQLRERMDRLVARAAARGISID